MADSTAYQQAWTTPNISITRGGGVNELDVDDGDTVFLAVFGRANTNSSVDPTGFTVVAEASGLAGSTASGIRAVIYRKYVAVAASEPGAYTMTWGTNLNGTVIARSVPGLDPTEPVQVADLLADLGADAAILTPGLTTTADGQVILEFVAMNTSDGVASWAAAGVTEDADVATTAATSRVSAAAGHRTQVTQGATGQTSWSASLVSGTSYGFGLGIALAVGVPAVVASAGPDQTVEAGELVTIDCSASTGPISSRALTQVSGAVTITNYLVGETTATVTFYAPKPPTSSNLVLVLRETVTGPDNSDTDDVTITITPSAGESLRVFILDENGDPT